MSEIVVDASVAFKWYVNEAGSDDATLLLEDTARLIAPDIIVAELGNAAWTVVRSGAIAREHGARIVGSAASAFSALVPSAELADDAFVLADALAHPIYGCFYLALAERRGGVMVTADRRFYRLARGSRWRHRVALLGTRVR
ncbi:MAG: type II toxin-antitoxin system VapC family toxin [Alphaproteobacteria bacterium]|nr:type II toxin-antitoxin system VapC family toxin [Alphaproteobacteria bacterium]